QGGWAAVATLEPTLGTMSRTFETDGFQADLAAQRNPAQFVGPLSHAVSLRAPSGLAHGLATAAQTTTHTTQSPETPLGPPARPGPAWPPPGRRPCRRWSCRWSPNERWPPPRMQTRSWRSTRRKP